MTEGGLGQAEGLEQVRWLVTCGLVDLVELSGGNAEQDPNGSLAGQYSYRLKNHKQMLMMLRLACYQVSEQSTRKERIDTNTRKLLC